MQVFDVFDDDSNGELTVEEVLGIVKKYDTTKGNGDGKLDKKEFHDMMQFASHARGSVENDELTWGEMQVWFDALRKFTPPLLAAGVAHEEDIRQELIAFFTAVDANHNSQIDVDELRAYMKTFDKDKDGILSREEFVTNKGTGVFFDFVHPEKSTGISLEPPSVGEVVLDTAPPADQKDEIALAFAKIDKDDSKWIDQEELLEALVAKSPSLSGSGTASGVKGEDDELLEYDEFEEGMRQRHIVRHVRGEHDKAILADIWFFFNIDDWVFGKQGKQPDGSDLAMDQIEVVSLFRHLDKNGSGSVS